MTSQRLQEILDTERTAIAVVYGHDAETFEVVMVTGQEIEDMARELLRRRGEMKIQVVSAKDGRHEAITLMEPITLVRGEKLNRLVSGTGMEHWFTPEGTYDGMNVAEANLTPDQASAYIEEIEKGREFPEK